MALVCKKLLKFPLSPPHPPSFHTHIRYEDKDEENMETNFRLYKKVLNVILNATILVKKELKVLLNTTNN